MIKTKTRIFNISSENAINGSFKSQFRVQLPDLSFHNTNIQNAYFSIVHCEVPNSFYIVNYTSNILYINNIKYVIPVGNYNALTLIDALLLLLPVGFNISYDRITNKYTFSYITNFTINSTLSTINKIIGLGNSDLNSTSNILLLPYVVNFLPLPRINFKSDYFKFGNYNSNDNSGDIFLSLQNNAGQNSVINYINQTGIKNLIIDRNITTFIINVCDDYGNLINFNNINLYMTIQIDIDFLEIPQNNNFTNIIKNF